MIKLFQVVVNIGKKEFSLGLTYVALSRAIDMCGLLMQPFCYDRISNLKNAKAMIETRNFLDNLEKLTYTDTGIRNKKGKELAFIMSFTL